MQIVVSLRSLLQDRMAALNGRTVEYVLKQDKQAFIRLIGLSVFQVLLIFVLPQHQKLKSSKTKMLHHCRHPCRHPAQDATRRSGCNAIKCSAFAELLQ